MVQLIVILPSLVKVKMMIKCKLKFNLELFAILLNSNNLFPANFIKADKLVQWFTVSLLCNSLWCLGVKCNGKTGKREPGNEL